MSQRESGTAPSPGVSGVDLDRLAHCVEACFACARACLVCAEARLEDAVAEERAEIARLGLGCADLCRATGLLLSRYTSEHLNLARAFLDTCAAACRSWADLCQRPGAPPASCRECRECREACLRCEQACRELVAALA
jgi:hypothetical protein